MRQRVLKCFTSGIAINGCFHMFPWTFRHEMFLNTFFSREVFNGSNDFHKEVE